MRVRCIALAADNLRLSSGKDDWLTIGHEYVVLAINLPSNREPQYYVVSENQGIPVWQEISCFEVVDGRIPPCWCVSGYGGGIAIEHTSWSQLSLEDYYNRKPVAVELFRKIREEIEACK